MEILYSRSARSLKPGQVYQNPRFFQSPLDGASRVLIEGDWPKIADAYAASGVPVEQVGGHPQAPEPQTAAAQATLVPGADEATRAEAYIPDNWRELPWTGSADTLTLRQLGALVSPVPVLKKADAIAAIEAELARRAAEAGEPDPEPEPETGEPE